ncbi:hypothetical protein EDC94DRAFT_620053 [Helicostylum pulchrum]|nr:hypothetical protein EDC94DRAFT_620053 [Helicostylum pulchrum]
MKLFAYNNQIQANKRLSGNRRKKFGNDSIVILRNWSACHTKFQEPVRSKGIRKTLRKGPKFIYLMNTKPRVSAHLAISNLKRLKSVLTQVHINVQRTLT